MSSVPKLHRDFDGLMAEVQACALCPRMCESKRVLNRGCGPLSARIVVIGEAPGRLGADSSELPFHGDKAGHNFEELLDLSGIRRSDLFITNAVLCNPKDSKGNNSTPTELEITTCASFLKRQIDLINPQIVVTLGAVALRATAKIEMHRLNLREGIRTAIRWYGRELVPLYHPGQRAMIHRSFANQSADYQFLSERLRRTGQLKRQPSGTSRDSAVSLAVALLHAFGPLPYFAFHKYAYLAECLFSVQNGRRLTDALYIRQKDGPYCVDLHPLRLKRAGVGIEIASGKDGLFVAPISESLFSRPVPQAVDLLSIVDQVRVRYGSLSMPRLKTAVYLTTPMRILLRRERLGMSQFNAPIEFPTASQLETA